MNEVLDCGHENTRQLQPGQSGGTGYGVTPDGRRICYECCIERDKEAMRRYGRATLYMTRDYAPDNYAGGTYPQADRNGRRYRAIVTDWTGLLRFPAGDKRGGHNMTGVRYDVWFTFEGQTWHGVSYGDNTQVCHCRRVKGDRR